MGLNSSLCNWVLDYLTGRPQVVKVGNITSFKLILNTGAPQGCVLSPLLYSLYTHDWVASHSPNSIIKFTDDTTVVGLINNHDETAYREEVGILMVFCQVNNLSLNVSKTKDLIVDFRRNQAGHTPILINRAALETVKNKVPRRKHLQGAEMVKPHGHRGEKALALKMVERIIDLDQESATNLYTKFIHLKLESLLQDTTHPLHSDR